MRIAILTHSFSSALPLYHAVAEMSGHDVFVIVVPAPHRPAHVSRVINVARLVHANSIKLPPES